MSRCFVKFIFLLTFCGLSQVPCFADKADEEAKKQSSLKRIYGVCGYRAEAGQVESSRRVIVADSGYDTLHTDLTGVFVDPYNPVRARKNVDRFLENYGIDNLHGTAVAGIIHDLTPTAKLVPLVYLVNNSECYAPEKYNHQLISLDYALNKAQGDIVNLSVSLSQNGYCLGEISQNVKDLFLQAFSQPKIIVCAAGNSYHAMDTFPYTQGLKELARLSNDKLIVVGATTPNEKDRETLWLDGSELLTGKNEKQYADQIILGSSYPGKEREYQEIFVAAPAYHYAPRAYCGDRPGPTNGRKYFGMTSSAAPVVTSFVERLWEHAPNSKAEDIGNAIYNGASQSFSGFTYEQHGEGMVNYEGSLSLLQTSPYQSLKVIED